MCGIAGFGFNSSLKLDAAQKKVLMSFLITAMDMRGGDSWGYVKLTPDGKLSRWRGLNSATGNMRLPEVVQSQQVMFHARKRTHGAVSTDNAHPFLQGHILGAHNGIVSNHSELNKRYGRDFDVDSQHIFQHLSDGLDVGEINLYGAISYIDVNTPNILYLCRCSFGGDLEIYGVGPSKEECVGIVYASTKFPIVNALTALRLPHFKYNVESQELYYISNGQLYTTNKKLEFSANSGTSARSYGYGGSWQNWNSTDTKETVSVPEDFKACKRCRRKMRKSKSWAMSDFCVACLVKCRTANRKTSLQLMSKGGANERHICCGVGCTNWGTALQEGGQYWCGECAVKRYRKETRIAGELIKSELDKEVEEGKTGAPFCTTCNFAHERIEGAICGEVSETTLGHVVEREPYEPVYCMPCGGIYHPKDYAGCRKIMGSVIPADEPYLESWDLCPICTQYREIHMYTKKFVVDDLCRACRFKWEGMITDLKGMSSEEKALFNPVVWCQLCGRTPCFGRPRGNGDKLIACLPCRAREVSLESARRRDELKEKKERAVPNCNWCGKPSIRQTYVVTSSKQSDVTSRRWKYWCSRWCQEQWEGKPDEGPSTETAETPTVDNPKGEWPETNGGVLY